MVQSGVWGDPHEEAHHAPSGLSPQPLYRVLPCPSQLHHETRYIACTPVGTGSCCCRSGHSPNRRGEEGRCDGVVRAIREGLGDLVDRDQSGEEGDRMGMEVGDRALVGDHALVVGTLALRVELSVPWEGRRMS